MYIFRRVCLKMELVLVQGEPFAGLAAQKVDGYTI